MANKDTEVVVLLSGGIDSAACLSFHTGLGQSPLAIFVDLGQPAAEAERKAARAICDFYSAELLEIQLASPTHRSSGEIVGRNLFLVSSAVLEIPQDATAISMGLHGGVEYPDCSQYFLSRVNELTSYITRERVQVIAPFIKWTKNDVYHYAIQNSIPIGLTYSCEEKGPTPCGCCLSCKDREALNACT